MIAIMVRMVKAQMVLMVGKAGGSVRASASGEQRGDLEAAAMARAAMARAMAAATAARAAPHVSKATPLLVVWMKCFNRSVSSSSVYPLTFLPFSPSYLLTDDVAGP